jgi:hypothetical protein
LVSPVAGKIEISFHKCQLLTILYIAFIYALITISKNLKYLVKSSREARHQWLMPTFSGDRHQKDHDLKPVSANSLGDPILEKNPS